MPNFIDWGEVLLQDEMSVSPDKWKDPITIEYGYRNYNFVYEFCWKVKGTEHTFTIPFRDLNEASNGDIEGHIQSFLEEFRKEYIEWVYSGLKQDWQQEYYEQYKEYIELQ